MIKKLIVSLLILSFCTSSFAAMNFAGGGSTKQMFGGTIMQELQGLNPAQDVAKPSILNQAEHTKVLLNKTEAIVNDKAITLIDLEKKVAEFMYRVSPEQQYSIDINNVRKQALNEIINGEIIIQLAKRSNVYVSKSEVDVAIKSIAKQNSMSVEKLKENVEADGADFNNYKHDIKEQLLASKFQRQAISQQIHITDADVKKWLAKHKLVSIKTTQKPVIYTLSNIVMDLPESEEDREFVIQAAYKIKKAVESGKSTFADEAKKHSDAMNAEDGGKLGSMPLSKIPSVYEKQAKLITKKGQVIVFTEEDAVYLLYIDNIEKPKVDKEDTKVKQYELRQIVIKLSSSMSKNDAKAKLNRIILGLKAGETFGDSAEKFSENYDTANNGGKVGWISMLELNKIAPAVATKLKELKKNQISKPFNAGNNEWQIIMYTDTRMFDDAKAKEEAKAIEALSYQKAEAIYKTWILSLRDSAYIKVLDSALKIDDLP